MTNRPITELDFFSIKEQLKTYLRGQDKFKDYDFDGSNMSVLLDVLAYNTYQNNFYTNMSISEMFLDSARNKNSVISHAKELNYLPRSAKAAKATIDMTITSDSLLTSILLPKGSRFSTNYAGSNYQFVTREAALLKRVVGTTRFEGKCIDIYQGNTVTERFFLNSAIDGCVLSNTGVDTDSIFVSVETESDTFEDFTYTKDIFGIQSTDRVYYIQPSINERYAVTFGRNTYGYQPTKDQTISVSYEINSGEEPNGAAIFRSLDYPSSLVTTVYEARGGAAPETLEDIKYFAPKSIQIQERAVTARDYEVLLKQRFTEIQAISVYGGDELDPPRYGKVGISVSVFGNTKLSTTAKNQYATYLKDKTPLSIEPIFIDPEFMYANLNLKVYYSRKLTSKSKEELENIVRETIAAYNLTNLNSFGSKLKVSRLSTNIDASDVGILNSSIFANPIIEYAPVRLLSQSPTFKFETELIKPYPFQLSLGFANYVPALKSSPFLFKNTNSILQDDGLGNIQVISNATENIQILASQIGTIDYAVGTVRLNEFVTEGYNGAAIKLYANSVSRDILAPKSRLLSIKDSDIVVNLIESA